MKKATINLSGLGSIYVPVDVCERYVDLCIAVTKNGIPINMTSHKVSFAKTHYSNADNADAAGYYLKKVEHDVFDGTSSLFILVSPASE